MDVIGGVDDDEHGAAADLAVVIVFRRHFGFWRDGDLEFLEAGGAGDGEGVHFLKSQSSPLKFQ